MILGLVFLLVLRLESAQAQTFQVLHSFTGGADGGSSFSPLLRDRAGNLYGTAEAGRAFGNGVVFKLDTANKETVLHSFAGSPSDGSQPYGGVTRDAAGNLYGTAPISGGNTISE